MNQRASVTADPPPARTRWTWSFVLVIVALTVAIGVYTANNFKITSDTNSLLSEDLPFRALWQIYEEAFPEDKSNLVVVLDGPNPDLVADGAAQLADRLRQQPGLFPGVFYAEGDVFFRQNGLLYLGVEELYDLSDRLAEAQPVLAKLAADASLRGLFQILGLAVDNLADGESESIGLDRVLDPISIVIEGQGRTGGGNTTLSWVDLMSGNEPEPADRRHFIVLHPRLDYTSLQPGAEAMGTVRQLAAELGLTADSGVRVRLTGSIALETEELASVGSGAGRAGMLSLLLVGILLFIGRTAWRLIVAVLATLIVGLVWTAGFAMFGIGQLNMISVAFAVLFIGLGVDFGIHFVLRYRELVDNGAVRRAALGGAVRAVGGSLALSAATSAAAFLSFAATDYRGIAELGIIAAVGMAIALALNLTFLPALLDLLPIRPATGSRRGRSGVVPDRFIRRHARTIVIVALGFGLAAIPLVPRMGFDSNPLNLTDLGTESVQTTLDLMSDPDAVPFTASVLAPDFATARRLAAELAKLDTVDKTVTLKDFVPDDQDRKLAIIDEIAMILAPILEESAAETAPSARPESADLRAAVETFQARLDTLLESGNAGSLAPGLRRLSDALHDFAARTGLSDAALAALDHHLVGTFPNRMAELRQSVEAEPVTIATLPADLRDLRVAADGRVRIEIFPVHDLTVSANLEDFVEQVQGVAPDATHAPISVLEGKRVVVGAFFQATAIALIATLILLAVVLRRVWDVALVMMPLALATVLTIAAAYLAGLSFNFANIIVLPLLFGLGVDGSIHLVRRARGGDNVLETSTPRAVLFSALTTMASFGALAISTHRGTASMGALLAIALTMTLISTLVVLPAIMAWRDRRVVAGS